MNWYRAWRDRLQSSPSLLYAAIAFVYGATNAVFGFELVLAPWIGMLVGLGLAHRLLRDCRRPLLPAVAAHAAIVGTALWALPTAIRSHMPLFDLAFLNTVVILCLLAWLVTRPGCVPVVLLVLSKS